LDSEDIDDFGSCEIFKKVKRIGDDEKRVRTWFYLNKAQMSLEWSIRDDLD